MIDPERLENFTDCGDDLNGRIAECASRLRTGDDAAANQIVELLDRPLRIKLRQKVPENRLNDVYQETWARFFEHLLKNKRPDNYIAWFLGIARLVHLGNHSARKQNRSVRRQNGEPTRSRYTDARSCSIRSANAPKAVDLSRTDT